LFTEKLREANRQVQEEKVKQEEAAVKIQARVCVAFYLFD
jgi:hypothetical protein